MGPLDARATKCLSYLRIKRALCRLERAIRFCTLQLRTRLEDKMPILLVEFYDIWQSFKVAALCSLTTSDVLIALMADEMYRRGKADTAGFAV